ncbi:bis(5'-adenosyl)-triphosphatase enpp4-like [Ptychodera flava]|uniref:bis(5'-adenosyl)-triphosphatase enpp4-like n=1 Tax=Ptychodera flava TaxID=63121 RepID=UPI00396A9E0F
MASQMYQACIQAVLMFSLTTSVSLGLNSRLLLISMDGFHPDYLDRANTPNFDQFIREGVRADYVTPTFKTMTFPCHYSIVTGLYQESHGIVGNRMYDPDTQKYFGYSSVETEWWDNGGEPIWVTVRKQGGRSASYFWTGSETETNGGYRPNIWIPYNGSHPFRTRMDTVVRWFQEENIDFITLYFNEPDSTGHEYGPYSDETRAKVEEMDELLGYLVDELKRQEMYDTLNIIVTTDHGMVDISRDRKIDLYDFVDPADVEVISESGAVMNVLPKDGLATKVYEALAGKHPNMTVYTKDTIPTRFHYTSHRRILPILIVCDDGWEIFANLSSQSDSRLDLSGMHGYDNTLMSMRSFFVARGPGFKVNAEARPFTIVDIYPMMCHLMGLQPAPNNGSLANTADILKDDISDANTINLSPYIIFLLGLWVLICHHI